MKQEKKPRRSWFRRRKNEAPDEDEDSFSVGPVWGEPDFSQEPEGFSEENPTQEVEPMYQNQPSGYYGPGAPGWDEDEDEAEATQDNSGRVPSPEEKEKQKERLYKCFRDPDYQTPSGNARCKQIAEATGIAETFVRSVWANYKRRMKKEAEDEVKKREGDISIMEREAEIAHREAQAKARMANANSGFGGDMLMYLNQMEQNRIEAARIEAENKRHREKLEHERYIKEQEYRREDSEKQQNMMMQFMNDERQRAHELRLAELEQGGSGNKGGGGGMFLETGDPEVDAMLKQRQIEGMFGTGWGPAIRDAMRPGGAVEMGLRALQGGQAVQQQYQMAQQNRFNPGYNPYQLPAPQPQPYAAYQNQTPPPATPPQAAPPQAAPPQQPRQVPVLSTEEYQNALFNHFRQDWPGEHLNVLQDQIEITVGDILTRHPHITDGMDLLDMMGKQLVVVQKLRDLSQGLYAIFDGNLTPQRSLELIRTDEIVSDWLNNMQSVDGIYRIAELYSNTGAVSQEYAFLSQEPVRDLLSQMFDVWHGRKPVDSIVVATPAGAEA